MRDILIHAYFGVEVDKIWNVVKKQLPVACMSTIDVDKVVDKFHNLMCAQKTK